MASGDFLFGFEAIDGVPPSTTAAASLDRRGNDGHMVYDFDAAIDESLDREFFMPEHYAGTTGITITIVYLMSSAISGAVGLGFALERHNEAGPDADADNFAAANWVSDTVPGTSGLYGYATITFADGADMDSVVAGEHFRGRFTRDADGSDVTDSATGDLELVSLKGVET